MDPYAPPARPVASSLRPAPGGPARAAACLAVSLMLTYIAPNVVAGIGVFFGAALANAFDYPVDDVILVQRIVTAVTSVVVWLAVTISLFSFTRATPVIARVGARFAVLALLASALLRLTARLVGRWYAGVAAFLWSGDIPEWLLFLCLAIVIRRLAPRATTLAFVALALESAVVVERFVDGIVDTPVAAPLALGAFNIFVTTAAQVVLAIALFKTRTAYRDHPAALT